PRLGRIAGGDRVAEARTHWARRRPPCSRQPLHDGGVLDQGGEIGFQIVVSVESAGDYEFVEDSPRLAGLKRRCDFVVAVEEDGDGRRASVTKLLRQGGDVLR